MEEQFRIGGWLAPDNTVEAYELAKGCGINTMYLLGEACRFAGFDEQIEAIKACQGAGVDAIPLVSHRQGTFKDKRFLDYDNVHAIMLSDEPNAERYPLLEEQMKEFFELYPKTMRCEVNLLPNYAPLEQLKTSSYFEYVEKYIQLHEKMLPEGNILSVDHYPMYVKEGRVVIMPLWLRCLSTLTYFSRRKNLSTHCFIQTMAFGTSNDVEQDFSTLRFQFMVYLAFGFRAFSHFCYASPGVDAQFLAHQEAIVGRDGKPTRLYEEVRKANALVQTFAKWYLPYTHKGTRSYAPEDTKVPAFEDWAEEVDFENASLVKVQTDCPALVGKFVNEQGEEAFFVTHYNWPKEANGKVELTFSGKKDFILHRDGKTEEKKNCDCLQIELEAGNGIFVQVKERKE